MNWTYFPTYALITAILWFTGAVFMFFKQRKTLKILAHCFILTGIVVLSAFIALIWLYIERPPMRTLGETRLWYALFLTIIGYLIYLRWRYAVILAISIGCAIMFLWINFSHPEAYAKELMPALQSPWFIPHVVVYILSYAVLGLSSLAAITGLFMILFRKFEIKVLNMADNLVHMGFAMLTTGMIFGALWAKEAWGHYWTWDPKETWALLTWLVYLIYIHYRHNHPKKIQAHLWILSLVFAVLLVCWFGISYLPSAQNSIHVYTR